MTIDAAYENLGFAIVNQTIEDYEDAWKRLYDAIRDIKECEKFFKSADCALYLTNLNDVDGFVIMERAKDRVLDKVTKRRYSGLWYKNKRIK